MPGITVGVYPGDQTAGTEVSSSDEGRIITAREDELIHPYHTDGFVDVREPVIICDAGVPTTYGVQVGVARISGAAVADLISVDSEGIFNLTVYAEDDDGNRAIEFGDQLYIRAGALPGAADADGTGDAEISKISNSVVQVPFGVAFGSMVAGGSGVIAVKVHKEIQVVGNVANKGLDHVQGTTTNPIEWGTTAYNVKQVIFNVGILTDYISGLFIRAYAEDAVPAGGIQGLIYSRITAQDDVQDMYAIRGRTDLVMDTPGAHIANMVVGGMFSATLDNAGFALTLADRIKALDVSIGQTATSTITTGSICGIYVSMEAIKVNNAGRAQGIYIYQGGVGTYADYGIYIQMESEHTLAGIKIEQLAVAAGWGIELNDSGGFGFDSLFAYTGVNAQGYFLWLTAASGVEDSAIPFDTATCGETADRRLRVRCEGDTTDRYIYLFPV